MPRTPTDLLYGTLDTLVLKTLSWKPMHGYSITEWLERRTQGTLTIDDAALYKSLHRLEERGDVEGAWGVSENNRRARYYSLTAGGRRRLRDEVGVWNDFSIAVNRVLTAAS
jgi:transcriptional regulator